MRDFFSWIIDALIPPRATEALVRSLDEADISALAQDDSLPYHDPRIMALVWELKYHRSPAALALAARTLSETVVALCAEELGTPLLIPVPLHKNRRSKRGFSQTEALCEALLPHLGIAVRYVPNALVRTVDTPPQQGLTRAERLKNVAYSMAASPNLVRERVCIVVDDVVTTGATLAEAQRALREAGARAIHTVVLARA